MIFKRQTHLQKNNKLKKIVLCDFDGTITAEDVTDSILDHFAPTDWVQIGEQYLDGKLTHGEMNSKFAALIKASPEEIKDLLNKKIHIRKGFNKFLQESIKRNIYFVVLSSGWDFYIKNILSKFKNIFVSNIDEILFPKADGIPIVSNKLNYEQKNLGWKLTLKWSHISCRLSSPCKGIIAKQLRRKGGFETIVVIGNSESDICMAKEANQVFSFGVLTSLCKKEAIKNKSVKNFEDIANKLFI